MIGNNRIGSNLDMSDVSGPNDKNEGLALKFIHKVFFFSRANKKFTAYIVFTTNFTRNIMFFAILVFFFYGVIGR